MVDAGFLTLRKADMISEFDTEARDSQWKLLAITKSVLQNNIQLSQRLTRLQYMDNKDSIYTRRQYSIAPTVPMNPYEYGVHGSIGIDDEDDSLPGEIPTSPQFETDLNASRIYHRAKRHSVDYSFCSSKVPSHAWTKFTDISLSDISVISLIALPITQIDINNGSLYEPQNEALDMRTPSSPKRPVLERTHISPDNSQ